jgi:hypothetical protein
MFPATTLTQILSGGFRFIDVLDAIAQYEAQRTRGGDIHVNPVVILVEAISLGDKGDVLLARFAKAGWVPQYHVANRGLPLVEHLFAHTKPLC